MNGLAGVALTLLIAPVVAQPRPDGGGEVANLAPEEMLQLGRRFVAAGDNANARRIYEALTRDPHENVRNEARFRLAELEANDNRLGEAAALLRAIVDERPEAMKARSALAVVLARLGDEDAALREVRALQAAALPPEVAQQLDVFANALRSRRPVNASFEIALAPDSNIQNATAKDRLGTILGDFQIDREGKARSGVGVSARGQIALRAAIDDDSALLAVAGGTADLYRDKMFNAIAFDAGAGPEWRDGAKRFAVDLGMTRRWYGMRLFESRARLNAAFSRPLGSRTFGRARVSLAKVDNRWNDLQDGHSWGGTLAVERALTPRTGVSLSLSRDRLSAHDPGYSTTAWGVEGAGWTNVGRSTFYGSLSRGWLGADERLVLFPDKRRDRSLRLTGSWTWRRAEVMGFAPVARLIVERNRSSIAFYDYRSRRLELGVARAF